MLLLDTHTLKVSCPHPLLLLHETNLFNYSLSQSWHMCSQGALDLASAAIGVAIFNILSKISNIPLLSIATSFVAEDISKNASKHSTSGNSKII